jgi:DNA-binding LytR/AlgR family response regulator
MNNFLNGAFEYFVIPTIKILFIIGLVYILICIIVFFIKKVMKLKSHEELQQENEQLSHDKMELEKEKDELNKKNDQLKKEIVQFKQASSQMLNVGNLKIQSELISYIVTQSYEISNGDSRIKVIHYINSAQTDTVYSNFDEILEKLPGNFMLINKNQLINLREIHKIQDLEVYLKGVKTAFFISEQKKEEFDLRVEKL